MNGLTTSEVAKRSGVNLQTIRYYEKRGLLPKPPRSRSGYRTFNDDAVRRVRFIKRAQELGFFLEEIKDLLTLRIAPGSTCADVRQRAHVKIAEIDGKIQNLRRMKKALKRLAASCSGKGPVGECPILESLDPEESLRT